MISSFSDKRTQKIFKRTYVSDFPKGLQQIILRKLLMVNAATSINDLRVPPSNNLKKLSGKRKNQYSIRINKQWRICFQWNEGNAHNLEIVDYHN